MTLDYPKDWYEHRIALEGDLEIGAGAPPGYRRQAPPPAAAPPPALDTRIAFGTLVELWRRNRGWDAVKLAEEAGVAPAEVLEIERHPEAEPEPRAVCQLARVFNLPATVLLELAGLGTPATASLREEAVRFAARSEPVAALSPHERDALESFLAAINRRTAQSG